MTDTLAAALADAGIPRVAHFTPSKNLFHIVQDGQIRSSKDLADLAPEYFDPTDLERFDRHPDKTCVSFTYPNAYYLAMARKKAQFARFPDWVCLMINPRVITRPGVLFSPCNAAKGGGVYAQVGAAAFRSCFDDPSVMGWRRGPRHHPQTATDLQAEVLVPGPIPLSDVMAIVVPSVEAAGNDYARLDIGGLNPAGLNWIVSPVMFDRGSLSTAIRYGRIIEESVWLPPKENQ
nr:DarT ssDNA thymidine ADP-ribosyltransferase family protein [Rhodococcus wratislaviensis]